MIELHNTECLAHMRTMADNSVDAIVTRDLTKEDAMITIDRTIAHFSELGIVLPEPGEQMRIE